MKEFNVSQFTKVLVASVIQEADDPGAEAADQVKRVLLVALKDANSADFGWKRIVEDACQGAMTALLLAKQDIGKGAVHILRATGEAAYELLLDPVRMRESTLQGIADMQRFVGPEEISRVRGEISRHFPAAGKEFLISIRRAVLEALHDPAESTQEIRYRD
jgi:hypothetical protein